MKLSEAVPVETRVAILKQKLKTLQDEARNASDDLREMIEAEAKQLTSLKQENRDLKATLTTMRSAPPPLASSSSSRGQCESRKVEVLEKTVHNLRRQWDKVLSDKKTSLSRLSNLQDNVKDLMRQSQGAAPSSSKGPTLVNTRPPSAVSSSASSMSSSRPPSALSFPSGPMMQGPAWREIRQLENRLEKALLKTNEAQSIRKTYESVIDRLKQEQVHYGAQGQVIEQEIKAMGIEQDRLLHSLTGMQKGRDQAKADLAAFEEKLRSDRQQRSELLESLRDQVRTLQQTNEALLQKQIPLADSALQKREVGKIRTEDEAIQALSRALVAKGKEDQAVDIDRLVTELLKEQESCSKLKVMVAMAKMQLSDVEADLSDLKSHCADLKGEGALSTQNRLDAAQDQLKEANEEAEKAREAHDVTLRQHADVLSGVQHLAAMIASIPPGPGQMPSSVLVKLAGDPEQVAEVLSQCEERLIAAYQLVKGIPKAHQKLEEITRDLET
jgi:chromosome segregation ATPase